MGACCVSSSKQSVLNTKVPANNNIKIDYKEKLNRCIVTKNFNFDNQNISDLDFLGELFSNKEKATSMFVLSANNNNIRNIANSILTLSTDLKKLSFKNNKFTLIPDEIKYHITLKTLDFSSNLITHIPKTLEKLNNLTELYLGNNQIILVPDCLTKLTNLQVVDLSSNQIENFTDVISLIPTQTIILTKNNIKSFNLTESCFKNNTKMTNLDLSFNKLTSCSSLLLKNSSIALLNLKGNNISYYEFKKLDGFDDLIKRRKSVKDQGFLHNLEVDFDMCGLTI
jgi:Leucine-rich repeat (LRR) protein